VTLTASNPANYTGTPVKISIVKAVNAVDPWNLTAAEDANDSNNPYVLKAGSQVRWTYVVKNLSGTNLTGIKIVDDNGTPNDPSDDFVLTVPTYGDNNNGVLDKNETWVFISPIRTAVAGLYTNIATVQGTTGGITYYDNDPASYFGWTVGLQIVKATNASDPLNPTALEDANTPTGQVLPIGTPVVWTYVVRNTGNIALTINLRDDFGTPTNLADDFSPKYVSGDTNGNGKIDPNEVWLFTSVGMRSYNVVAGQYGNLGGQYGLQGFTGMGSGYLPRVPRPDVRDLCGRGGGALGRARFRGRHRPCVAVAAALEDWRRHHAGRRLR